MRVQQSGELACVMLVSMGLMFRHLLSEAVSESRADVALHCFKLLFKTLGVKEWILVFGLLEFEQAVPVGRNGDRWVLGKYVFMEACFDHCEESWWVILNSGMKVG